MRKYKTGATRSDSGGKIEYLGFRHPLSELSFGKYMHGHRIQEDGKLRDSNNWWKGLDPNDVIQSLNRHVEDLNALHAGYVVAKIRFNGEETTEYIKPKLTKKHFMACVSTPKGAIVTFPTKEDCCNAIRFNADAYKLDLL